MLAEQEHAEQGGGDRVEDGEARLRGGQRARRERVGGQQHPGRAGDHQRVGRPVGEDGGRASGHVRAELLDHGRHEAPGNAGRDAEQGSATGRRAAHPLRERDGDRDHHQGDGGGQPPQGRRVVAAAGRRRRAEEDADSGAHDGDRQPVAPAHPGPGTAGGRQQRQVAEDEQQLDRQDRLNQGKRAELERADLERESGDHAGQAQHPGGLAGQPEDQPGVEAAGLSGSSLQVARAETLADRGGRGAEARCQ